MGLLRWMGGAAETTLLGVQLELSCQMLECTYVHIFMDQGMSAPYRC